MPSKKNRSLGIAASLALVCVGTVEACSGPEFSKSECDESNCAGMSSGGSAGTNRGGTTSGGEGGEATGGSATGGSDKGGSDSGGSGAGGSGNAGSSNGGSGNGGSGNSGSGSGGTDNGGSGGTAGTDPIGFPAHAILDDFNREGPELGLDWVGSTIDYAIVSQTLHCQADYCAGAFWYQAFGASQEVFGTLASFSNDTPEINLVLKARGEDPDCELIEVLYAPPREEVLIEACWDGTWHSFGTLSVRFEAGDQLGGRFRADGFINVFRNGELTGSVDARTYPHVDLEGRIGVNGVVPTGAAPNVWDDFGGGSLP